MIPSDRFFYPHHTLMKDIYNLCRCNMEKYLFLFLQILKTTTPIITVTAVAITATTTMMTAISTVSRPAELEPESVNDIIILQHEKATWNCFLQHNIPSIFSQSAAGAGGLGPGLQYHLKVKIYLKLRISLNLNKSALQCFPNVRKTLT